MCVYACVYTFSVFMYACVRVNLCHAQCATGLEILAGTGTGTGLPS